MVMSMWASTIASWFTPTILFCFLNLMIASIFIASKFKTQNKQHQLGEHNSPQLVRTPSLLARVKSINFSLYKFDHHYPFQSETQFADPVQDYHPIESEIENHGPELDHHVTRSKSDTCYEATPERIPAKIKKSASEKAEGGRVEEKEEAEVRRRATMRERKSKVCETVAFREDEAVDARADDFINRFKQQLKLQRLDSLLRYKEMLSRGSAK